MEDYKIIFIIVIITNTIIIIIIDRILQCQIYILAVKPSLLFGNVIRQLDNTSI